MVAIAFPSPRIIVSGVFFSDNFSEDLDDSQKAAIRFSLELGRKIQDLFPHIADDYRKGNSYSALIRKYGIQETFGISKSTALEAARRAVVGYNGNLEIAHDIEPYEGLITDTSELERIAKEHNRDSGRRLGLEKGRYSGAITYERGTGVHGMTYEEKRKAGQKGIIVQGNTPWSDEEIARAYQLAENPAYQRKTRINAKKITEIINTEFHNGATIRKPKTLTKMFVRENKRKN